MYIIHIVCDASIASRRGVILCNSNYKPYIGKKKNSSQTDRDDRSFLCLNNHPVGIAEGTLKTGTQ